MPTLEVTILRAHNLAKKDIFGASDPYVKMAIYSSRSDRQTAVTKTMKRTLNPVWNQWFHFHGIGNSHVLDIEVFDANRITKDDFLGQLSLPLRHEHIGVVGRDTIVPRVLILQQRSERSRVRGTIEIKLAYLPEINDDQAELGAQDGDVVNGNGSGSSGSAGGGSSDWVVVADNAEGDDGAVISTAPPPSTAESHMPSCCPHEDSDLPAGWEARCDANGRRYYVDHASRRTQWERPQAASAPLPRGWLEKTDPRGRVYYVDQVNRRTQWERPTIPAVAEPADQTAATSQSGSLTSSASNSPSATRRAPPSASAASSTGPTAAEALSAAAQRFRERRLISQEDATERVTLDDYIVGGNAAATANSPSPTPSSPSSMASPTMTAVGAVGSDQQQRAHRSGTVTFSDESRLCSIEDLPLPSGWQAAVAPNGRKFFINHNNKTTTWRDPREETYRNLLALASAKARATGAGAGRGQSSIAGLGGGNRLHDLGPLPPGWEERVHSDNRVFYINHNLRCTQWEDPRLELKLGGPAVPYSRDYKQKYEYFRSLLKAPKQMPNCKFDIRVKRSTILEDSFNCIMNCKQPDLLKARLWVDFSDGGKGLDYGGLTREWFFLLSRELFNPYYALFEYSASDNYTLQINPQSGLANPDHLNYFKFIGRVAAMAIWHGKLLDGFFIRPFYKMMLGRKIVLKDMESVDAMYFNSLQFIVDNNPEDLDLTFSVEEEVFGKQVEYDLIPDGRNILVTNDNKDEYIDKVITWRFVDRVKDQMSAFMKGFSELIDPRFIQIFDAAELELLLCGLQDIDVNDWKRNTLFKGDYDTNHPVIISFWRAVYSFNNETRARLLQFVTGTSRVPMNGFSELWGSNGPQKFTIERWGSPEQLPRAHTCFNRIDLPPYPDYDDLRAKLLLAIENSEGFDGVD